MAQPTDSYPKDDMDWSQQLALVTGATGGIGKATVIELARVGCPVALHYHAASKTAQELVHLVQQQGGKIHSFQADLSNYEGARKLHEEVIAEMGHPTILFNNAGSTLGRSGIKDISEVDIEEFEKSWRTNAATPFLLTQLCLPAMIDKGWGRVIFNTSIAGFTGGRVGPHYASAKSALHGLTHWLATAYAKKGITVNGIAPALIEGTSMWPGDSSHLGGEQEPTTDEMVLTKTAIPVGRFGKPKEIADTVIWMIKTGYVTNKVIGVDGGMWIQ